MAELDEEFAPSDVPEDERSFQLIPPNNYDMQVIDSSVDPCNGGKMVKLTMEIITGQYANRRLWDNLCIQHNNPETQRIAQRALADLCLSIGHAGALRDTEDLHFKPFVGKVSIKKASKEQIDKGYPDDKNVVRYRPASQSTAQSAPSATTTAQPNTSTARQTQNGGSAASKPAPAAGARPWKKAG